MKNYIELKSETSKWVRDWLYFNGINERPSNILDEELRLWWEYNIKRILNDVMSLHEVWLSHDNWGDQNNYVISRDSINLIDVGGNERFNWDDDDC